MNTPLAAAAFFVGAVVSLGTSWVLVTRIERIGSRLGASEAMLGLLAALAADTPEITSAVSALVHRQQAVGAGIVVGSNVFNLAALLGLGAVVAGGIAFHRRVVLLTGAIALWIAAICLLTIVGVVPAWAGLVLVVAVLVPYVLLAAWGDRVRDLPLGPRRRRWLAAAIIEEELELHDAVEAQRGRPVDFLVASLSLVVVVTASVAMERAASALGVRLGTPAILVGGVVLAAVTSLPNAVAAVYLARRGRGAAMLSTALNSNALNVAAGLLLPGAVLGLDHASANQILIGGGYCGLTLLVLVFAYRDKGLRRYAGYVILGVYAAFVAVLVATA